MSGPKSRRPVFRLALFALAGVAMALGAAAPLPVWSVPTNFGYISYGQSPGALVVWWKNDAPQRGAADAPWDEAAKDPALAPRLLAGEECRNLLLALVAVAVGCGVGLLVGVLTDGPPGRRAGT